MKICDVELGLIPQPLELYPSEGFFCIGKNCTVNFQSEFRSECEVFASQLANNGFFITLNAATNPVQNTDGVISCIKNDSLKPDEYRLNIGTGCMLEASDGEGVFYGLQTLRQLFLTHGECIPRALIVDKPAYKWRGLMLDTVRSFATVQFLKKLIDALSLHKINRFHWHLTDDQGWRLPVPGYERLCEIGSKGHDPRFMYNRLENRERFYTHEQIREVVHFAAERHIMVVPEIETPGHASAILAAYPELGCTGGPYEVEGRFGIFDDVLCAGNDAVFHLLDAVFDTVVDLFPSPYIHIGGDECPHVRWETCPKCQKRIADNGLNDTAQLQSWVTAKVAQMIASRDKTPVGWDEVLDGVEKLGLPSDMVVMSWRGTEGGITAGKLGHQVIMAPQTGGCYLDYPHQDSCEEPGLHNCTTVEMAYNYSPIPAGYPKEREHLVLGGQGNVWAELLSYSRWTEYMIFPRLCALSEALWLPAEKKEFTSFEKRLDIHKKRLDALDLLYYRGKHIK